MIYKGSCHCGSINFEVDTDLSIIKQCNCSICKRKYSKMGMAEKDDLKITKGSENLTLYQFGSNVAKHYFCKICGIYTHHNPRSNPAMTGFNVGCIDEINTFNMKDVPINDGQNHPLDKK